ncbi:MAG: hypothetical protein IT434_06345 [Phycisphaerales bacterium]|jgi:hypothetical protein|nr:hypothetical protein [Phycisphaerales bacterium]
MPISAPAILGAATGAIVLIAGLWLLREPKEGTKRAGLSVPTRMATALALLVLGYHVAAWSLPDSWTPIKLPIARWWVLAIAGVLMLSSSVAMDRRDETQSTRDEEAR